MKCLSPDQIQRVFDVTDRLGLHRNWVVVPLAASDTPSERVMPDGKVLLRPPGGADFEDWVAGLQDRLENLELDRTPKIKQHEIPKKRITEDAPTGSGGRRLYLDWENHS